ncbi:MAG: type I methionyl aminopeptidase [Spirochaetaceae bacterium]|nr:MAG: type I methionyl aminopeptidase [Spirochaetaceae bacterium]
MKHHAEELSGTLYSRRDLYAIRATSSRLSTVLSQLIRAVRPGVSGVDLNAYALHLLREHGLESALRGYQGFPGVVAISPDSTAAHGIPDDSALNEGSIVSLDMGVRRNGWHADAALTVPVGTISRGRAELIRAAHACCRAGIRVIRAGCDVAEIGAAVRAEAARRGVTLVSVCGGHGVGRSLHEPPHYRYDDMPHGLVLRRGNVITVEPVITGGPDELMIAADGHSMITMSGRDCAQFEYTVYVDENGPVVLTE